MSFEAILSSQNLEVFGQLGLAVLLASLLGIERSLARRLAGFRTFAMVALGSCLFVVISNITFDMLGGIGGFDPSRIASQIVVGIGFLAGGSIIFNKEHLQGLTTAAGLWVAAGIGMAVGFKLYAIAVFVTILSLMIFEVFWRVERKLLNLEGEKKP